MAPSLAIDISSFTSLDDTLGPDYEFLRDIGRGSFGFVRSFRYRPTGATVAVKFIERAHHSNESTTLNENVRREVINHRRLMHPHVVRFLEARLTRSHLALVMEYCGGGELFSKAGRCSEGEARYYFQHVIAALSYIHAQGICHRDIKLENTLLDRTGPGPKAKICDLGYSKYLPGSWAKSKVGTAAYIAPEVLQDRNYGLACDMWSVGVMLHTLIVGRYPFNDPAQPANDRVTLNRIVSYYNNQFVYVPPGDRNDPNNVGSLLAHLLTAKPQDRATISDVWRHPWFNVNLPQEVQVWQHPHAAAENLPQELPTQAEEQVIRILELAAAPSSDGVASGAAGDASLVGGSQGSLPGGASTGFDEDMLNDGGPSGEFGWDITLDASPTELTYPALNNANSMGADLNTTPRFGNQ
ncbi:hypothetical protein PPROV_000333500 [Pycnococcus provasolii]|uniref:Protein kinase domain-containing protein n=1 Tax=Pycnococcus provasolii TaxID=41880 RepID=A0A830HG23_9CHLO|nr:hypothetical protein PPROV_000333500 [Pycnococcus provasolii]|mmetsp:Transcript_12523/g.33336  ORF Transcript_12523/g.33336 Transcript_12523/m.33336 type:complete len:412 (-) Transcript_12523:85-1320(-)